MEFSFFSQLNMELHALTFVDALTVGTLVILEGILSVDNALVLAILVRPLPKFQQRKALTYGILGAFAFRFVALLFAGYLMKLSPFKLIGGAYLLYLAMKHMFFFHKDEAYHPSPAVSANFWRTIFVVELTDIAFSIDSITTAVAMSDKLLIVWVGGILSITSLRLVSGFFIRLLERLPKLEDLAYQLIFFVGTKLTLESFHVEIQHWMFWLMMAVIATIGAALVYRDYYQQKKQIKYHHFLIDQIEKGEMSPETLLSLEYIPRAILEYLQQKGFLEVHFPNLVAPYQQPETSIEVAT